MVAAMERDLVRPLTEEEERLVLEPGPLVEQPPPQIILAMIRILISSTAFEAISADAPARLVGYEAELDEKGERLIVMVGVGLGYIVTDAI